MPMLRFFGFMSAMTLVLTSVVRAQVQPATLEMVDANDRVVGPIVDRGSDFSAVGMDVEGHSIFALVGRSNFGSAMFLAGPSVTVGSVFYLSTDCSGSPYIGWVPHPTTMEPQAIAGPNATVFVGTPQTPQTIDALSVLRGPSPCASTFETVSAAVPATSLTDLLPYFTPPFHVRSAPSPGAASVPAVGMGGLIALAVALALLGSFLIVRRMAA